MPVSNLQEFISFIDSEAFDEIEKIELKNWPMLDIKVEGGRYNGTITPELAKSLYDFYMDLQRSYAFLKYGSPNLQRLTQEDRKIFSSIEYRIEEGSLAVLGDLCEQAKAMFDSLKGVTDGMESSHKKALYITIVLALLGAYTVNKHFDYQTQVTKAENERKKLEVIYEGQQHSIDALLEQSKASINALSAEDKHKVNGAIDKLDDGYGGIIRSVPDADLVDIAGAAMDTNDIAVYVENPQPDIEDQIIEEELNVEQFNKRSFPRITLRVSDLEDNQFTLKFTYGDITRESYDAIFDSIKNNNTVLVKYNALLTPEGVLHKGTVLSVSKGSSLPVEDDVLEDDSLEDEDSE